MSSRCGLALIAAALVVLLAPFPVVLWPILGDAIWFYQVQLYLADLPLAAVALLSLPDLFGVLRQRPQLSLTWLALAILGLLWIALVVHPSPVGVQTVLRLTAVFALAGIVARSSDAHRSLLAVTVAISCIVQFALATAQLARGGPLGLPQLGEFADPLLRFGGSLAPRGTMEHPYLLGALAAVAAGSMIERALRARDARAWIAGVAVSIAAAGLTYSRSSPVGIALAIAALAPAAARGSRLSRSLIAALVIGAGVPALLGIDGWVARSQATVSNQHAWGGEVRGDMLVQTMDLMRDDLLFGIGPGRTAEATRELARREPSRALSLPPGHNVPMLVASEAGVPAGILASLLLILLGVAAYKRALLPAYFLFLPFILFDHFAYTRVQGVVLMALWAGTCANASKTRS